jgi:2,3,4,5-tetrahydropyridine-2-carboxylate N-succinyltransferase
MRGSNELDEFRKTIENAWEIRTTLQAGSAPAKVGEAVDAVLAELDEGRLRVAEKLDGEWITHQWLKKAVLLSFRLEHNQLIDAGPQRYFDKVPSKFARYDHEKFVRGGFRVVPPTAVRRGSFIGKNVVLMSSYVNIGAYVDSGTMVDTWATVGSCAQIGKRCISPAASASAACSNRCRPTRRSSKTTALSAPVRKSSKASSSAKDR